MTLPAITGTGGIQIRRGSESRDVTPFNHKFVWTDSLIEGGWTWSWVFDTEDWQDWERLILGRDEGVGREFRLSTQEGATDTSLDWRRAYVDGSKVDVRGRSLSVKVQGGDVRLRMRQDTRTRFWEASSASDVMRKVAAEHGLTPDIEESQGRRDRWQLRKDNWTYISGLARTSATASGRGDSYLWVDGDTLRFGAPNLGVASARRHDLSDLDNRADKVLVTYHGRAVDRRGGAHLIGVSYDVLGGEAIRFDMDGGAANTHPALADQLPRPTADARRVVPFLGQTADLVESSTRSLWGMTAPRYFTMRLETRPDLSLRAGSVVELQASLNARQSLGTFGRYVVLEVQHVLEGADLRTTVACFRREAFAGDEAPTGPSVSFAGTRDRTRGGRSERPRSLLVAEVLP